MYVANAGQMELNLLEIANSPFAGAVVVDGTLTLSGATITDTLPDAEWGGGFGVYANDTFGTPVLTLLDSTVGPHDYAAIWLDGPGTYDIEGNTLSGSAGLDQGTYVLHGNALFAENGVTAWDGTTGLLLWDNTFSGSGEIAVLLDAASADLDGNAWSDHGTDLRQQLAALVQGDGDPEGEIAFVTDEGYHLYDSDGTEIVSADLPSSAPDDYPGPPCVADFDGDGDPELAVATYDNISVLELDGTLLWSAPTRDAGPTGCSGFDFDGDGAAEVITHDIYAVYVLDGSTGATLWEWRPGSQITNGQGSEYAYVADVDADGVAEIVASTNGGVPTIPDPPWNHGVFRSRPTRSGATADLLVEIGAVCVADCAIGAVEVTLQVTNQGLVDVTAGRTVDVYAVDETAERLVATVVLPDLPTATRIEATTLSLAVADIGTRGFAATVDPHDAVRECDEANNRAEWLDVYCP